MPKKRKKPHPPLPLYRALPLRLTLLLCVVSPLAGGLGHLPHRDARTNRSGENAVAATATAAVKLGELPYLNVAAGPIAGIGADASIGDASAGSRFFGAKIGLAVLLFFLVFSVSGFGGEGSGAAGNADKTKAVMDALDSIVYVVDPAERRILYFNRKFSRVFNIDADSVRKMQCWEIVGDGSGPCASCRIDQLRAVGGESPRAEREWYDKRSGIWLWMKDSLIRWVDGGEALLCEGRDISARKGGEEECARREAAARDALDASEMKSIFLATMSHEIRTPMNGIIGFADLAQDDADVSAATRIYLEKIKDSALDLLGIIEDILDIARIESGDAEPASVPFRLEEVFDAIRTICQPRADEKGLALHFYTDSLAGKRLRGDPVRIRRILLCFLTNALKFTERGGINVRAVVEEEREDGAALYFEVMDTGIGMTPEQMRVAFEPFTQLDVGVTRKYGGVGAGLAIAKNLIEGMGGTLEAESAPGAGSRFGFRLVLAAVDGAAETVAADGEGNPYKDRKPVFRGRVLVCEDNFINQEVIVEHLAKVGLDAVVAGNGREGVDAALAARREGRPFDLALMDIHMPVMGGLEAAGLLAESGETMPVVALTANVMPHDCELYREYGLAGVVGKPFKAHELWSCLARHLEPVDSVPFPAAPAAGKGVVDRRLGLERSANDEALYARLRGKFLKANRDAVPRLVRFLDAGEHDEAHRLAHTLKGTLAMLGAETASAAAREIETALAAKNVAKARGLLGELEIRLAAVLDELAGDLAAAGGGAGGADGDPDAAAELDAAAALETLDRLIPLLESGNSGCLEMLDGIRKNLSPLGADCAMLVAQMEEYDFDPACETAERIRGRLEAEHGRGEVQHTHRG